MKIKTSALVGAALDWAVAKCEGTIDEWLIDDSFNHARAYGEFSFSTNWALGGPIIGREGISLEQFKDCPCMAFKGTHVEYKFKSYAPEGKPLIAAMRCYVASKLGEEVDVPEELTKGNNNAL